MAEQGSDKATDKRCTERGILSERRKGLRQNETDNLLGSKQRRCGAEFKAGMGQNSKLLESCHLCLPPPTKEGRGKKKKSRERKEVNENQTHSPVWSGCEQ